MGIPADAGEPKGTPTDAGLTQGLVCNFLGLKYTVLESGLMMTQFVITEGGASWVLTLTVKQYLQTTAGSWHLQPSSWTRATVGS